MSVKDKCSRWDSIAKAEIYRIVTSAQYFDEEGYVSPFVIPSGQTLVREEDYRCVENERRDIGQKYDALLARYVEKEKEVQELLEIIRVLSKRV